MAICCKVACEQLPARQAAGPPIAASGVALEDARFGFARRYKGTRQAEPNAGSANRHPLVERNLTDRLQIAIEHRIDDGRANALVRQIGQARPHRLRSANDRRQTNKPDLGFALARQHPHEV